MAKKSVAQKRREKSLKRQRKQKSQRKQSLLSLNHQAESSKLSAILLDYASPLLEMMGDDSEDIENAIAMATVCWNIGNYPDEISHEMQDAFISNMLDDLSPPQEVGEELSAFMSIMIDGRRTIFSEDPRFVMDYEILWCGDDYRLRVFSSLVPPEMFDDVLEDSFEDIKSDLLEKQNS